MLSTDNIVCGTSMRNINRVEVIRLRLACLRHMLLYNAGIQSPVLHM